MRRAMRAPPLIPNRAWRANPECVIGTSLIAAPFVGGAPPEHDSCGEPIRNVTFGRAYSQPHLWEERSHGAWLSWRAIVVESQFGMRHWDKPVRSPSCGRGSSRTWFSWRAHSGNYIRAGPIQNGICGKEFGVWLVLLFGGIV